MDYHLGTVASQYDEDNPTMQFLRKDNLRLEEERKAKEREEEEFL